MNKDAFLTCLSVEGISSGVFSAIEGLYTFQPNGVNPVGDPLLIFNQLYTTGSHYLSGAVYTPDFPLINISPVMVTSGNFTGDNVFRIGYQQSGSFALLIDLQYDACQKRNQVGNDYILFSTTDNPTGLASGFFIGINDANRLYCKTQNASYTVSKELSSHNFVYIGVGSNQFINFGIYDFGKETYYGQGISLDSATLTSETLYLGGALTFGVGYTGLFGTVNQVMLFNDTIDPDDMTICTDCSFVTGYVSGAQNFPFTGQQITGALFSGQQDTMIIGYTNTTGTIYNQNNSPVSIIYQTPISVSVTTGEVVVPLIQNIASQVTRNSYTLTYDSTKLSSFAQYILQFTQTLDSQDIVEIRTYPRTKQELGISTDEFNWPIPASGFVQLYGNGLSETSGIDFIVDHNQISGYDPEDLLMYDILPRPSIVTNFTGTYLSLLQYVVITGNQVTGITTGNPDWPSFNYDLALNGQKLVSGHQWLLGTGAAQTFNFLVHYPDSDFGGELSFLPSYVNEASIYIGGYTGFSNTGNITYLPYQTGTYNTIAMTGFSEEIWINGVRQKEGFDYFKIYPCSMGSGVLDVDGFNFLVNDNYFYVS